MLSALLSAPLWACDRSGSDPAGSSPPARSVRRPPPPPPGEQLLERAFLDESPLFTKKRPPRSGDWLDRFEEPGQSFLRYRGSDPVRRTRERNTIVVVPLGSLDARGQKLLSTLREFASVFFAGPVELGKGRPLPGKGRRIRNDGGRRWTQHHTTAILEELEKIVPPSAVCVIAVTLEDLYPEPAWNFVFGQATLERRVGVYSLARFFPEYTGEPPGSETDLRVLRRSCQLLAHETGHMFSLEHCIDYECLMNGSNSLDESDRQPNEVCPICLRKLHHALDFDVVARYQRLRDFYRRVGLRALASWMDRRLTELQLPNRND